MSETAALVADLIVACLENEGVTYVRLHLALVALATMQQGMEWMEAVIALRSDVAQRTLELLRRKQLHSTISIPSSATCQPALSTLRRSAEPPIKIGLVLLI